MTKAAWSLRLKLLAAAIACIVIGFIAGWLTRWLGESGRIASGFKGPGLSQESTQTPEASRETAAPQFARYSLPAPGSYNPAAVPTPVTVGNYRLEYNLGKALLPDPKLTPGNVFSDATADDVCTPGWAKEHRHVTEEDRARVYAEYPDSGHACACVNALPGCCEVDHLIPLELGGSNDIKNLWPQPDDPRPGDGEKDQLENVLHELVCRNEMTLGDAQKCIASNWIGCWQKYVVPRYGVK